MKSWERLEFMSKYLGGTILPRFLMDWLPAMKSSALFTIVAEKEPKTLDDYLNAGKAVQRFWLQSAALNLGFQPTQTPVIFSEYIRNDVNFTDNTATQQNAIKMDGKLKELFDPVVIPKIIYMGRVGRSEKVTSRSVRLSLDELRHR
jgi:hypothetical protein